MKTNGVAIWSLVLSLLAYFCFGIIGAIPAIILGIVALSQISNSRGTQSGKGLAVAGIVLGGINTLVWVTIFSYSIYEARKSTSHKWRPSTPPRPTYTFAPPAVPPKPPPATTHGPRPRPTRVARTIHTKVGHIEVIDIGTEELSLRAALAKQASIATKHHEILLLETTSESCRPCLGVAAALSAPSMQKALENVRLVRVQVDQFPYDLKQMGLPIRIIPGFFLLDPTTLEVIDAINGGEWDEDTARNIAPVLGRFVRHRYQRRREPMKFRRTPSTGTLL